MIKEEVDGHTVEVGEDLDGQGRRVYIDGDDYTNRYLQVAGIDENPRGMRIPRGDDYVFSHVKTMVRLGRWPVENEDTSYIGADIARTDGDTDEEDDGRDIDYRGIAIALSIVLVLGSAIMIVFGMNVIMNMAVILGWTITAIVVLYEEGVL